MNPILKIRPWLWLNDASSYVNETTGVFIDEQDLFHAASAGHLTLSVFFGAHPNQIEIHANGKPVSDELFSETVMDLDTRDKSTRDWLELYAVDRKAKHFHKLRYTNNDKFFEAVELDFENLDFDKTITKKIHGLPEHYHVVVRSNHLDSFIKGINAPAKTDKLDGRLKNNLLKCIAALCEEQGIVIGKQGEAQRLVKLVERAGWSISDETINSYFDMINELKN